MQYTKLVWGALKFRNGGFDVYQFRRGWFRTWLSMLLHTCPDDGRGVGKARQKATEDRPAEQQSTMAQSRSAKGRK